MLDRLEERRAIAKRIADARAARENVNAMPEVIAARARADAARKASDEAQREFRRIFDSHYLSDDVLQAQLLRDHPDLYQHEDIDSDCRWVVCCVVTGLPIFEGDRVIEHRTGDESYERHLVLADAVSVVPELQREPEVAT